MFVGHAAVALAARSVRRDVPLGMFLVAAFGLDLIWPVLLLFGVERVSILPGATLFTPLVFTYYPWSHSLLMAAVWGMGLGLFAQGRGKGAGTLVAAVVVSHWALDVVTHGADLPLWPGRSPLFGLGLWNSIAGTYLVEGALFAFAVWLYLRATRARDRIGSVALIAWIAFMLGLWATSPFSPPPPSVPAVACVTLGVWLLILWGAWSDAHREPVTNAAVR
ncbi:MAG TPA: hypothetical protein VJV75_05790 [Candidatus Polarisedimenticolia bacterium]|nr:hypothetical protein [Candidatus Polarisedimenticolia bacterium]